MPKIILKYKSPEFADHEKEQKYKQCDMPNCQENGEYKAPKHRGLNEYYLFCTNHIKEYNKAWDFFAGMSEREVQEHMTNSLYGDRPTWKYNANNNIEEELYKSAKQTYSYSDSNDTNNKKQYRDNNTAPEYEAMAIMGLNPPVTLKEIKTRYKTLAKKYHPDLNKNNKEAEELLKKINMAYTILKLAFQEYEKLPNK